MREPKFDLDIDDNLNAMLIIECGKCARKIKKSLNQLSPVAIIKCACGTQISISDDNMRNAKKSLNDLKRTLNSFG